MWYKERVGGEMKKVVLWIILNSIFLVVFNIIFFILGGAGHNAHVWISYGFIHFSYLMLLLTPLLIRKGNNGFIFGMSLYSISIGYFFVELFIGTVFILVASKSNKAALLTQIVIASIYVACLISNIMANEQSSNNVEQHETELKYVKKSASNLNSIIKSISDPNIKKKVEKAYDLISSSPVRSHSSIWWIELDIMDEIEKLSAAVNRQNNDQVIQLLDSIIEMANERNRQLRLIN